MAVSRTKIEWTETTWNPTTGCTRISEGCRNCYAERMAKRLKAMGQARYANGFELAVHEDLLYLPLQWKKPRIVFVNSMSDLFHEQIPDDFIIKVFHVMNEADIHTFQVLTKRPERAEVMKNRLLWGNNIWIGTTVENKSVISRLESIKSIPAAVRFISCEPLLESLEGINLEGINWVIAGGESGPRARPMDPEWVRQLRDSCINNEVPFFFKQWGGTFKCKTGRILDGRTWDEYPI